MSYSTVYGLWPGEERRVELAEFRNSWGMAPLVWNAIAQRHLGAVPHAYMARIDDIWPLHEREDVPLSARAVLRMTFDTRYILATDVKRASDDIAEFLRGYRNLIDPAGVNHWPTYVSLLLSHGTDGPPAFGVQHTSVSENPWQGPYDEASDSHLPFDWSTAASVYFEDEQ